MISPVSAAGGFRDGLPLATGPAARSIADRSLCQLPPGTSKGIIKLLRFMHSGGDSW
jgi:hypothetical protein